MANFYDKLNWQEEKNGVRIDCSLDIAIHPSDGCLLLLTIPGVDGSVEGYKNKYRQIAESVQEKHDVAVVRMANPYITSFHWESNLRHVMEYIDTHATKFTGTDYPEIRIMAHSAGAAIAAQIAWEFPKVSYLLLINPASDLGLDKIKTGLSKFKGEVTVLYGSEDPKASMADEFRNINNDIQVIPVEGADHNFSGEAFRHFLKAPHQYLFT